MLATLLFLPSMATTACQATAPRQATTATLPDVVQRDAMRGPPPGAATWSCPFPEEAERNNIDAGSATIMVYVETSGLARAVYLLQDSGSGFGQTAMRCAATRRYAPARDRSGAPVGAWTPPITMRFARQQHDADA
ncbi:hypothetical protein [Sorangium cellulosum]|uniref:hypothetical protein n=1 Tax=Sorangium cellulosum TaxID=56 RepID=UPI0013312DF5|nr:hypothetical protein [Sorangium cellulosum]